MGTHDMVVVNCLKCGGRIEFQSKAGPCKLVEYSIHDVPAEIEADLEGAYQRCHGCGETIQINLKTGTVTMTIS